MRRYVLFAFAASIPFVDMSRFFLGGNGSVAEGLILPMMFAALVALSVGTTAARRALMSPTTLLVGLWLFLGVFSWLAFGAKHPVEVVRLVEYALVYATVAALVTGRRSTKALLWGLIVGAFVAALVCVVHRLVGSTNTFFQQWAGMEEGWYYAEDNFRVHGSFGNPLNTVTYLSATGALAYALMRGSVGVRKWVFAATAVGALVALLFTGSKSALLAPILIAALERRVKILLGLATLGVAAYFGGAFDTLIVRAGVGADFDGSVLQRLYVLGSGLRVIFDHPLLGVGVGNFGDAYLTYKHPKAALNASSFTTENLVLQTAAEMGILAAVAFVAVFARSYAVYARVEVFGPRAGLTSIEVTLSRAASLALLMYAAISMIQSNGSADLNLLLFTFFGLQQGIRSRLADARLPRVSGSDSGDREFVSRRPMPRPLTRPDRASPSLST